MSEIIGWLAGINWWTLASGAFLGAVGLGLRTVIQAPVKALAEQSRVIQFFFWLSPQKPLAGLWQVTWYVDSERYPKENVDRVKIRRFFGNVSFTTKATLKDGSSQQCVFVGKLADRAVTGRWFNPEDQDRGYFGAFQFRIHGSLREGEGTWIGWRNDGTIASDTMKIKRLD